MNEILTASTGVIMSQSPGSGFPHFESCSWVVKVEPGYNITFTIEHFQTSRQFDELEIFDGECALVVTIAHDGPRNPQWTRFGLNVEKIVGQIEFSFYVDDWEKDEQNSNPLEVALGPVR